MCGGPNIDIDCCASHGDGAGMGIKSGIGSPSFATFLLRWTFKIKAKVMMIDQNQSDF